MKRLGTSVQHGLGRGLAAVLPTPVLRAFAARPEAEGNRS